MPDPRAKFRCIIPYNPHPCPVLGGLGRDIDRRIKYKGLRQSYVDWFRAAIRLGFNKSNHTMYRSSHFVHTAKMKHLN